jgi:hypothetical protein
MRCWCWTVHLLDSGAMYCGHTGGAKAAWGLTAGVHRRQLPRMTTRLAAAFYTYWFPSVHDRELARVHSA